jgi:hypothetical protein
MWTGVPSTTSIYSLLFCDDKVDNDANDCCDPEDAASPVPARTKRHAAETRE